MRRLMLVSLAAAATVTAVHAQTRDPKEDVLQTVKAFFGAMQARDSAKLASMLDANARLTLLRPGQGGGWQVVVLSGAQYVQVATNPNNPPADEKIRNPIVQLDGDLATVWAEYQLLVNGAVSHCGTDAFHLVRISGSWKVLNISDTFRQSGCGAPW